MTLNEEQIADLKYVLEAAREHIRMNEPEDLVTMAAILAIEAAIEAHENG